MNIDMELNFTYVKGEKKQAIKIDNTFNDLMTGH